MTIIKTENTLKLKLKIPVISYSICNLSFVLDLADFFLIFFFFLLIVVKFHLIGRYIVQEHFLNTIFIIARFFFLYVWLVLYLFFSYRIKSARAHSANIFTCVYKKNKTLI